MGARERHPSVMLTFFFDSSTVLGRASTSSSCPASEVLGRAASFLSLNGFGGACGTARRTLDLRFGTAVLIAELATFFGERGFFFEELTTRGRATSEVCVRVASFLS